MASGDEIDHNYKVNYNAHHEMETALVTITNEINKLYESSNFTDDNVKIEYQERVFKELIHYKSKMISKKKLISKLKEGMRIACFVMKILMNKKINEVVSLNTNLGIAKNKIEDLEENAKNQSKIIKSLTKENCTVCDELQNLKRIINSSYQQLQINQNMSLEEDISSIVKLKDIIIHCSKNNVEINNIQQKFVQVSQRNSFLTNKLNIISQNLDVTSNELWNCRSQILRLQKENSILKNKAKVEQEKSGNIMLGNLKGSGSETKFNNANFKFDTDKTCFTDLRSHLNVVKRILNVQDEILKELTGLSRDYLISDCNC